MGEKKKQGIYLVLAGAAMLVGMLVFAFVSPHTVPGEEPNATSTEPIATTTDIFDMEPIIPEAKVSTEGWKTCRNEEYGYEFKFPAEWKIYGEDALSEPNPHPIAKRVYVRESEECNGAGLLVTTMSIQQYQQGPVVDDVRMGVRVDTAEHDPTAFVYDYVIEQQNKDISTLQSVVVDNHLGVLQVYSHVPIYGGRGWRILVARDGYVYRISGGHYDIEFTVFEAVLSTFHFLNTASTTDAE